MVGMFVTNPKLGLFVFFLKLALLSIYLIHVVTV